MSIDIVGMRPQALFLSTIAAPASVLLGTLHNCEETETTTGAAFHGGDVELNFEHYLITIKAVSKDGELDGDGARASVTTGDSGLNRALCVRRSSHR